MSQSDFESMVAEEAAAYRQKDDDGSPETKAWPLAGFFYLLFTIIGTLAGIPFYMGSPLQLSERWPALMMADLRYPGAVAGSLAGAVAALLLCRRPWKFSNSAAFKAMLFFVAAAEMHLLCAEKPVMGAVTALVVLLPWTAALLPARS